MKIKKLHLKAFGPFSDFEVDLDAPPGAVNVVFGQNEAGKSSALRALEGLCFGIPDRTTDDHIHNYDQMRVGATLRLADGSEGTFIRRKGKKNTLSDAAGPIPDEAFERYLCGVSKSGFEALFCLSYKRLNEGSDSILEEGGELGKLLFEARSDLSLRSLQSTLSDRMATLYRGTARSSATIDDALKTFDSERRVVRKGDLAEYKALEKKVADLKSQAATTEDELNQARTNRHRLDRLNSAIPTVRRLKKALADLESLGEVPNLNSEFAAAFAETKSAKLEAEHNLSNIAAQHDAGQRRLEAIAVDAELLIWRGEIERLNTQVEQITRHLADIPREEKKANEALTEARTALARVRPGEVPNEASLQIGQAQKRIFNLGLEKASLDQKLAGAKAEMATVELRLHSSKRRLDETSAVNVSADLFNAISTARALGDAEAVLETERRKAGALQIRCDQSKAQLGGADKSLQEFVRSVVPSRIVVQDTEDKLRAIEGELRTVREALQKAGATKTNAEADRRRIVDVGNVPTEEELFEARSGRDARWSGLKSKLVAERTPVEPSEIAAFESGMELTDTISDRLRREADRVAALAAIEASISSISTEMAKHEESAALLEASAQSVRDEWAQRWHAIGVTPYSPRQMVEWLTRFDQLSKDAIEIQQLEIAIADRSKTIDSAKASLASQLGIGGAGLSLSMLLRQAEDLVLAAEKAKGLIVELNMGIREGAANLETARKQIEELERRLEAWSQEWQAETACLGMSRVPTPDEADDAIKAISTASERLIAARSSEKRVNGMRHDFAEFANAAEAVVKAVAPNLGNLPPLAAIQSLYHSLSEAITLDAKRSELLAQQASQAEAMKSTSAILDSATAKLAEFCRQADCESVSELESVVARISLANQIRANVNELTEQLEGIAGGRPVEEFCRDAEQIDPDTAHVQLDQLQVEIEVLEKTLTEINQGIGKETTNLQTLDSENTQIDSQLRAENALAKVRSAVRPYLVYTLAESLVRAQIEEFRQAHQGPILVRASEIFSSLTDGSFSQLQAEVDDKDQPVLVAVRRSRHTGVEERLRVEALSSATRIGLYLSLRLACMFHHLEHREGLPFVADDILLDFDDARAKRVMQELGRLAEKTQVILFTHHRHLVEIGKEVLSDRCVVQSLAR